MVAKKAQVQGPYSQGVKRKRANTESKNYKRRKVESGIIIADTSLPKVRTRSSWQKRNEEPIISSDTTNTPKWYQALVQQDIFTGKNLGQKFTGLSNNMNPEKSLNELIIESPVRRATRLRHVQIPITPLPIGKRLQLQFSPHQQRKCRIVSVLPAPDTQQTGTNKTHKRRGGRAACIRRLNVDNTSSETVTSQVHYF